MSLSTPGLSGSEIPGTITQISQSQRISSQIRVEVSVLRADNVPKIAKRFRLKNQFFVTVSNQATTMKTASVSIKEQTAQWNQKFDAFFVQPSSRLVFCLYAKRLAHPDKLIGTHEIPIPVESQSVAPFVLRSNDGQAGASVQPVTLYLTITVSGNATSRPIFPTSATATEVDTSPMEQATVPTIADAQDTIGTTPRVVATTPEPLSPPTDHVPIETSSPIPPVPDAQATMSPAKDALHVAEKATDVISLASTWEGAIERIKWVMDTQFPRHS
ncbi:hypothetical protein EI94DRAFT_1298397 [Lactarius quietus]|nr:hypothetical protein EI94DRAFT_1298397 [Lactarius quietus]